MYILYLFLSLFASTETKPVAPLKIAVLYYTPINKDLRAELIKNITATFSCFYYCLHITLIACFSPITKGFI